MPMFDDTHRTFLLDGTLAHPDLGVTALIRNLGPSHLCELYNFQARIKNLSTEPIGVSLYYWVVDEITHGFIFMSQSDAFTLAPGVEQSISMKDYVFSPYDYFYVSVIVTDWGELTQARLEMHDCILTTPNDPLLMQRTGWLLNDDSSFNVGYLNRVFMDARLRRNVYGETLTVDPTPGAHTATFLREANGNIYQMVVYKDGAVIPYGADGWWLATSPSTIEIANAVYDPASTYTADYYTSDTSFRFSDSKLDLAKNEISVHSPLCERQGYYCNDILDGLNRYYDVNGNVAEIVDVDAWGRGAPDIMQVGFAFKLSGDLTCTADGDVLSLPYTRGQIMEFDFIPLATDDTVIPDFAMGLVLNGISDGVAAHTAVYQDGVLLVQGVDWDFISTSEIGLYAYTATSLYSVSYQTPSGVKQIDSTKAKKVLFFGGIDPVFTYFPWRYAQRFYAEHGQTLKTLGVKLSVSGFGDKLYCDIVNLPVNVLLLASQTQSNAGTPAAYPNGRIGQTFLSNGEWLEGITIKAALTGNFSSCQFALELYTTSAGLPSSLLMTSRTMTFVEPNPSPNGTPREVYIPMQYQMPAGTLAFAVKPVGGDVGFLFIQYSTTDLYSGGTYIYRDNFSPYSWHIRSDRDLYFKIYTLVWGNLPDPSSVVATSNNFATAGSPSNFTFTFTACHLNVGYYAFILRPDRLTPQDDSWGVSVLHNWADSRRYGYGQITWTQDYTTMLWSIAYNALYNDTHTLQGPRPWEEVQYNMGVVFDGNRSQVIATVVFDDPCDPAAPPGTSNISLAFGGTSYSKVGNTFTTHASINLAAVRVRLWHGQGVTDTLRCKIYPVDTYGLPNDAVTPLAISTNVYDPTSPLYGTYRTLFSFEFGGNTLPAGTYAWVLERTSGVYNKNAFNIFTSPVPPVPNYVPVYPTVPALVAPYTDYPIEWGASYLRAVPGGSWDPLIGHGEGWIIEYEVYKFV